MAIQYITMRMPQRVSLHSLPQKLETTFACFWIDSAEKGSGTSLNLDWKMGIAAKDWDTIAKKEKIEVWLIQSSTSPTKFQIYCIALGF